MVEDIGAIAAMPKKRIVSYSSVQSSRLAHGKMGLSVGFDHSNCFEQTLQAHTEWL
jgi:hypothetical protein